MNTISTFTESERNFIRTLYKKCKFNFDPMVVFYWLLDDEKFNAENGKRALFDWQTPNAIFIDFYQRPEDQIKLRPEDIQEYLIRSFSDIIHESQHRDDFLKHPYLYRLTGFTRRFTWEKRAIEKEELTMLRLRGLGLLDQERIN